MLAYARSTVNKEQRAEYGMFVDQKGSNDHLIYNPVYKCVVSRQKVVAVQAYPREWKLISKPRVIATRAAPTIEEIMPSMVPTDVKAEQMAESINTQLNPVPPVKVEVQPIKTEAQSIKQEVKPDKHVA